MGCSGAVDPRLPPKRSQNAHKQSRGCAMGLGWAQTDLQDWRAQFLEPLHQQKNEQSGLLREWGRFISGSALAVMYMSYFLRGPGGKLGVTIYEFENCSSSAIGTCPENIPARCGHSNGISEPYRQQGANYQVSE